MAYPPFHPASAAPVPLFMSEAEFGRAFPSESDYIERKSGFNRTALQEAVVAFSNADGGVILIGVDDAGVIVGRELSAALLDDVHRAIGEAREPGRYATHELNVDGKPVVVVSVSRRVEGFSQTSSGRILVRRGTMKTALFGAELARFVNERSLHRFEETDARVRMDVADPELVAELGHTFGWTRDIPERLAEHGLALRGARDELTVAGALYLLADPAEQLGKAFVEILRFPEVGAEYDRRLEVRGPLHRQLQRTVDEIVSELGTELVVLGVRRYELPRVPTVVLREAVANALAHRSYEMTGTATRVELYPHVVRIISPGGLPEPVTVDNIRETQAARNYRVITVLRRFGLAEDAGRGVDVMVDSMLEEMLEPPVFEDSGAAVIVDLPIRSAVTPTERAWVREVETRGLIAPGDRLLLVHAARGERLTNGRVRELTGAAKDEARRALQRLRDADFLVQHGERGGASYTLNESLAPPAGLRLTRDALKEVVLQLATHEGPPLTNARVRERTGLDRVEALRLLDELVSEGLLERTGTRRGTRYVLPTPYQQ
jgi:ATP-dependent DNA helicase RecG